MKLNLLTKKDKKTRMEKVIDSILEKLSTMDPSSEEYEQVVANLETLMKAESYKKDSSKVSADTKWVVIAGILELVLIMGFEQSHVITTKAFGRILRGRV